MHKRTERKKKDLLQIFLCGLVLILFALFVRNVVVARYEMETQYRYITQVSSLDMQLREGDYGSMIQTIRKQQVLGQETLIDRSSYETFADYVEAFLLEKAYRSGVSKDTEKADAYLEKRNEAENKLTEYRFRKAIKGLKEWEASR